VSAGESDIVLAALGFALALLLAGWMVARAIRRLRRRRRTPNHEPAAADYEDFLRLVEQAGPLPELEPNSRPHRRRRKPAPMYRRTDNGQFTTETYAKQHPTKTTPVEPD
jgi:ABC-type nickel/cobalt efflux system permease component RcnA